MRPEFVLALLLVRKAASLALVPCARRRARLCLSVQQVASPQALVVGRPEALNLVQEWLSKVRQVLVWQLAQVAAVLRSPQALAMAQQFQVLAVP